MVLVGQRLVVQNGLERHVERSALAGIAVHFTAFASLKMAHPRAAANDLPVFRYLDSLLDALRRHNIEMSLLAQ
jgi:hypothetical protein